MANFGDILSDTNALGVFLLGTLAARPASSLTGRFYWATDTLDLYYDTGGAWLKLTNQGGGGPPEPHAASHENGGSDEISVAGLSGLLADGQTPLSHSSAKHDSSVEATANKGAASGYAGLGANSRVPTAQLGSGTADNTTFLRGDQTWAAPAGGSFTLSMCVALGLNEVWTNMPLADTEFLGVNSLRPRCDLTGATQFRLVVRVQTAGATDSDLRLQCSTDGSTFGNADGSAGPEIAIGTTGDKDTGWQTLSASYRADNIRLRVMGKDGNGTADPRLSAWAYFK